MVSRLSKGVNSNAVVGACALVLCACTIEVTQQPDAATADPAVTGFINGSFEDGTGENAFFWQETQYAPSAFVDEGDVELGASVVPGCGLGPVNPAPSAEFESVTRRSDAAAFAGHVAMELRAAVECSNPGGPGAFRWRASAELRYAPEAKLLGC